jgi:hypothetical protein
MSTTETDTYTQFVHAQVKAWNARDKTAFLAAYKAIAPGEFLIEYVGRSAPADGWAVLEQMWTTTNAIVDIEECTMIANGSEIACHNYNHIPSRDTRIETIELYKFNGENLFVRYFVKQ